MIINTSAIPHRWRNRFLRDTNGNYSFDGTNNISNSSSSSDIGNTFEPHLLWGQYFDDTEDISGDLTCDGTITAEKVISPLAQLDRLISDNVTVNEKLTANQLQAVSGYIQTLLSDSITTDYLTVTKAAHFFKLIIDEIKATQGAVIITPANAKLDKVEVLDNEYRCYYRANDADGNQIYNNFEVNDQVVCQTFNVSTGTSYNVFNKFYWRKITATGTTTTDISGQTVDVHYFDLSKTDCALSSSTPSVGDECVLLGSRTDTTRQAAIVISAYDSEFLDKGLHAPSIAQYAGINDYNLSTHRLNVISNGLNQFKGAYSNNNGTDIEQIIATTASTLDGKVTTVSGVVSSHTESISQLEQTDSRLSSRISSNTTSIGTLNNNLNTVSGTVTSHTQSISSLEQTAQGLTSTVQSQGQSITSLNNSVTNLNSSVTTNTQNISSLQQTAQGLTSTVSSHTQSITNLSNDVQTIENDYVTSSQLNQTASGISATVTSDIEGKLLNTGININTNKINITSDNTILTSSSGNKVWLKANDTDNNEIFALGRSGNYTPYLRFAESSSSTSKYATYSMDSIYLNHAYNDSISIAANGAETLASFEKGTKSVQVGINNSNTPFVKLTNGSYEVVIYIDSSGKLRIKPSSKNMWISDSDRTSTSSGEIYADDNGFLKINNWS